MWHSNYLMPSGKAETELSDHHDCLQKKISSLYPFVLLCCNLHFKMLQRVSLARSLFVMVVVKRLGRGGRDQECHSRGKKIMHKLSLSHTGSVRQTQYCTLVSYVIINNLY